MNKTLQKVEQAADKLARIKILDAEIKTIEEAAGAIANVPTRVAFEMKVIDEAKLSEHKTRVEFDEYGSLKMSRGERLITAQDVINSVLGKGPHIYGLDFGLVDPNTMRGHASPGCSHSGGGTVSKAIKTIRQELNEMSTMRLLDFIMYEKKLERDSLKLDIEKLLA